MGRSPRETPVEPKTNPPEPDRPEHPAPEEDLGGGDICSLEEAPSTDDDKPLP